MLMLWRWFDENINDGRNWKADGGVRACAEVTWSVRNSKYQLNSAWRRLYKEGWPTC